MNMKMTKAVGPPPGERKRAANSMPSSAQKRVKVGEQKEVSGFNLKAKLQKIESKQSEPSILSRPDSTPFMEESKDHEETKDGDDIFGAKTKPVFLKNYIRK